MLNMKLLMMRINMKKNIPLICLILVIFSFNCMACHNCDTHKKKKKDKTEKVEKSKEIKKSLFNRDLRRVIKKSNHS